MEATFSGYCRNLDAPRLVLCEVDEGEEEIGCDYACCPYADGCPIGEQITKLLEKEA